MNITWKSTLRTAQQTESPSVMQEELEQVLEQVLEQELEWWELEWAMEVLGMDLTRPPTQQVKAVISSSDIPTPAFPPQPIPDIVQAVMVLAMAMVVVVRLAIIFSLLRLMAARAYHNHVSAWLRRSSHWHMQHQALLWRTYAQTNHAPSSWAAVADLESVSNIRLARTDSSKCHVAHYLHCPILPSQYHPRGRVSI